MDTNPQDLSGNAMSSTVVAAAMFSALIATVVSPRDSQELF